VEAVSDERALEYGRLLVDRCIDPKPGWQVMVLSTPLARPVLDEVQRQLGRRGAYCLLRLDWALERFPGIPYAWATEAPDDLLRELAPIELHAVEHIDARITIEAPENTRDGTELGGARHGLIRTATKPYYKRSMSMAMPWVSCQYPTEGLAQDAGMTLSELEDFMYGAILRDWDNELATMQRVAERFGRADQVRIVGDGTDLRFSIAGRVAEVDSARVNMPGGEVFFAPVEDSTEGVISYSEFPAVLDGNEVAGARLRFEGGRVVEASAEANEEFLLATLDTDDGARRLGEFGIGCNEGIQRHMKNVLFDEKMGGTIHLAIGQSYEFQGGKNTSAVHWDMVKDLRNGGRIELDGEVVQENGRWVF
jgi:aminopeptidase